MDYTVYRQEGDITQTVNRNRYRYFPVSCANRTVTPWDPWTASLPAYGNFKIMAGNRTPGYFAKRKRGDWVMPNIFYSSQRTTYSVGTSQWRWNWNPLSCSGPALQAWDELEGLMMLNYVSPLNGPVGALATGRDGDLNTQVVTECMANRQKGQANYVESLAEIDRTFAMIRDPLVNFTEFCRKFADSSRYRRLEKLRKAYGKEQLRPFRKTRLGQRWLMFSALATLTTSEYLRWRYGVSPLISDVKAAMKSLRTNYRGQTKDSIHNAKANGSITNTTTTAYVTHHSYVDVFYKLGITQTYSVRANWADRYKATPWTDLGLTFHNLVGVAWELTHFSFVYDWFVNVGELIYANLPRIGVTPLGGSYFSIDRRYNAWSFDGFANTNLPQPYWYSGSLGDILVKESTTKRRQIIDPQLRNTGLVIKSDFRFDNWTRALDAVALASQQLHRISF
jgi:hypothetical protein